MVHSDSCAAKRIIPVVCMLESNMKVDKYMEVDLKQYYFWLSDYLKLKNVKCTF